MQVNAITPWIPSPYEVIVQALELVECSSNDIIIDMGAGDGRVLITFYLAYKCYGVGLEINEWLCSLCKERFKKYNVLCDIIQTDFRYLPLRKANVIFLYLYESELNEIKDVILNHMPIGTKIITIDFPIRSWNFEKCRIISLPHKPKRCVFLYIIKK